MGTANPAHSPTSWATFLTGTGPGRNGVFGFIRRIPGTYRIETVLGREESIDHPDRDRQALLTGIASGLGVLLAQFVLLSRWQRGSRRQRLLASLPVALLAGFFAGRFVFDRLPEQIATPIVPLTGTPFWEHASREGRSAIVLGAPLTYPPENTPDCHLLCGFGTPDLRGTMGYWTLFTSAVYRERPSGSGGLLTPIQRNGRTETSIVGPDHPILRLQYDRWMQRREDLDGARRREADETIARLADALPLRADLSISVEDNSIALATGSTSISLHPGEWSDWVRVEFRVNRLLTIPGMVRFRAIGIAPEVEIYMTPVQFDPRNLPPQTSLSAPHRYAGDLWERAAPFPSVGWPSATNALKDERIDESLFLETVEEEFQSRRALTLSEVERKDWDLLVTFHYTPDRVSHMLWRHLDPASPRHDPALAERGQAAMRDAYARIDRLIGEIRDRTNDRPTILLVVSDHGFAPFRKGVHLNAWLRDAGFLVTKEPHSPPAGLGSVDWSQTRAYSVGLGKIFLNLAGREPSGIVEAGEAESLSREIATALTHLRDPDSNDPIVRHVYDRSAFPGPFAEGAADLIVGFESGYRTSWETVRGGIPSPLLEPNPSLWSGDHASVDPTLVPGVFFSNHRFSIDRALSIADIGSTVLTILGIAPPEGLDGRPIEELP